jgi:NOL1/NOP2/sun family putative RNA methylase
MKKILSADEYENFVSSYDEPPVRGLRINSLKTARVPEKKPVPWCKTGFIYPNEERPAKSVAYHAGLFYIQESSAMSPAEILGVERGHRVLDLCAAPGGKSVQIAGHLQGEGLLVSNDASPTRCRALIKNLERAGVTNAVVLTEQPKKLAERFGGFFDRILVDAPCSGEGMFRRDADAIKAYTANKPEACAAVQRDILRHAASMLKRGGRMVYSTCTFNTIENEEVIAAFLEKHEDFSLVQIEHSALGLSKGRGLSQAARIFPHEKGEGHFIALLERAADAQCHERQSKEGRADNTKNNQHAREFKNFCDEFLNLSLPCGEIITHGINLYFQQVPLDLRGLRVARSGWHLGECAANRFAKKNAPERRSFAQSKTEGRFVPSHALAMGLRKEQAKFSVELSESDAQKYLRGESLSCESEISEGTAFLYETTTRQDENREHAETNTRRDENPERAETTARQDGNPEHTETTARQDENCERATEFSGVLAASERNFIEGKTDHETELIRCNASRKCDKPWVLICHEGFPLGWARLVQGRLKNNLPVGWAVQ